MSNRLGVLIVDDSTLTREALRRILSLAPELHVLGEARSGEEALDLVRVTSPRLVTMDLNMPGMGGLKAIEAIMAEKPTPIVVISERSSTAAVDLNYEALSRGALELVPKSAVFGAGPEETRRFVERLVGLARAGREEPSTRPPSPVSVQSATVEPPLLVGIGASTGGPRALARVLKALPRAYPLPVVIVQHMAEEFFDSFVRFLRDASGQLVELAREGVFLEPGRVYVAPPRQELFVREDFTVKLVAPPPGALISPTVDSLFFSLANALKARAVGVLLTGMGEDGAQGLLRMRRQGARTIAQDHATSAVYGMPRSAAELGAAAQVLPLDAIGPQLIALAGQGTAQAASANAPTPPPRHTTSGTYGVVSAPIDGKKRVLLVDDEPTAFGDAKVLLERAGYSVLLLDNPLMLARTLRRNPVDVVLLEPAIKSMKAASAVQTLRTLGAQVPVCLWGAAEPSVLEAQRTECDAVGVARKGDGAALLRLLQRVLDGSARTS
jgi:two-component system chemotaxis response regulator CheB